MIKINQKIKLTALLLLVLCVFLQLVILFLKSKTEVVYIDNNRLFHNFTMTKEIKNSGEKEFNSRKSDLDLLYTKLQSNTISAEEKKILMQEFIQRKEELEQFEKLYTSEQSLKIWARIKSYSSEFSKENKYKLIIGSENNTNVLFADEDIDVTDELITYINKKYEGVK